MAELSSLSEPAQKMVNHIFYLLKNVKEADTPHYMGWYIGHEYPTMGNFNHETGRMIPEEYETSEEDPDTGKMKIIKHTRMVKEVVVVHEEVWVKCTHAIKKEVENYLVSIGYEIERYPFEDGKVMHGCFVRPPDYKKKLQ